MKIEEIKTIAAARSPGEWICNPCGYVCLPEKDRNWITWSEDYPNHHKDSHFIVMAANNIDKLIRIVEIAKYINDNLGHWFLVDDRNVLKTRWHDLTLALAELETE